MSSLRKELSNIIGWSNNRKIIVIESDDWGSVRIRSNSDYKSMISKGLVLDKSIYTKFDGLESNNDLENLFEVLSKHKDSTGRNPVFTPMCILANPDFAKIRESDYKEYYYENFTDTCNRYPRHDKVLELWKIGNNERLFAPALHGREHLSVKRWMKLLQQNNYGIKISFDHESIGVSEYNNCRIPEYLGAFHPDKMNDIQDLKNIVHSAGELFFKNLEYGPTHFIAPNRESAKSLDEIFREIGVKYMTMAKLRHYPLGDNKYKNEFLWLGKYNKKTDQYYITRNCSFEQVDPLNSDWVNSCMKEIDNAFKWKKPAVISSHRVNYISLIRVENANIGLKKLDVLLTSIIKKWPDVEFMTSTELGQFIETTKTK